jgi:hypothetical protein
MTQDLQTQQANARLEAIKRAAAEKKAAEHQPHTVAAKPAPQISQLSAVPGYHLMGERTWLGMRD